MDRQHPQTRPFPIILPLRRRKACVRGAASLRVQSLYIFACHCARRFALLRLLPSPTLCGTIAFDDALRLFAMAASIEIIPFSNALDMYGAPDRQ